MNYSELSPQEQSAYREIQGAMIGNPPRTITFDYVDSEGKKSRREAEPYEMKNGRLFGWCLERDALRQFKLAGMTQVMPARPFRPRPGSNGRPMPIVTDLG